MSEHVLKPCPFCGSSAHVTESDGRFYVACDSVSCWCALGEGYDRDAMPDHMFPDRETATERWNTRTPADNGEVVKELIEASEIAIRKASLSCDCFAGQSCHVCEWYESLKKAIAKIKAVSLPVSGDFSKSVKTHETLEKIGRDGGI